MDILWMVAISCSCIDGFIPLIVGLGGAGFCWKFHLEVLTVAEFQGALEKFGFQLAPEDGGDVARKGGPNQ